jgi:hypothetical protein
MRVRSLVLSALALALVGTGTGCGGDPKPVKVQGKVTLDGQPVANALVVFLPVEEGGGRQATGSTKADGSFQLETFKPGDGALPGQYKVTVNYTEAATYDPPPEPQEGKKLTMKDIWDANQKRMQEAQKKKPKYVIPEKYTSRNTPFTQKVPPDGPVNLDLKSK